MSELNPFISAIHREAIAKMSLGKLYEEDTNRSCSIVHENPVSIEPVTLGVTPEEFSHDTPEQLFVFPSKKDSENYLPISEQLNESLHGIHGQAAFRIEGNQDKIVFSFYANSKDLDIIESAVSNFYPNAITERSKSELVDSGEYSVYVPIPNAEFYKAHSTYSQFNISPVNIVPKRFQAITDGTGVFEIVFLPLRGEFHEIIEEATDCEWQAKHGSDSRTMPSIMSGAVNKKLEYKSPDFRSYFSVCARIIVPKGTNDSAIKAFFASYVHGSKAYEIMGDKQFTQEQIKGMHNYRHSYCTGFPLNAHELTSWLHIPYQVLDDKKISRSLVVVPAGDYPEKSSSYKDVQIGTWACGNNTIPVHLPSQREIPHVHIPGVSRSGKSVLLSHIAIEKFKRGEACFVFDPHGDLISNILRMLGSEYIDKVVVIDFGLEGYTPQFTIRDNVDISNPSKVSDDLSESMTAVGKNREKFMGPKMIYIFQCLYFIYCVVPNMNMMHIRLMVTKTRKAKVLRAKVRPYVTHPIVNHFLDELENMSQESLMPVITILSHLLLDEKSLRLFTQEENKISISDIMENGKLCLVNLAIGTIGRQRSSILSGLLQGLISNNALARANIPYHERKVCSLISDECHLSPADVSMQLTGLAKFGVTCFLSHQLLGQIEPDAQLSMSTAGTKVIFKLHRKDAEIIGKDLEIDPSEITGLKQFQAFVKIENEVVKVNTPKPIFPEDDFSKEIMQNCLDKYYLNHAEQSPKEQIRLPYDKI